MKNNSGISAGWFDNVMISCVQLCYSSRSCFVWKASNTLKTVSGYLKDGDVRARKAGDTELNNVPTNGHIHESLYLPTPWHLRVQVEENECMKKRKCRKSNVWLMLIMFVGVQGMALFLGENGASLFSIWNPMVCTVYQERVCWQQVHFFFFFWGGGREEVIMML